MQGQRIGYVWVSSLDQNRQRQLEHVDVGRVFTDKASDKDTQRPKLNSLLILAREATSWWCTAWIAWRATSMTCAASHQYLSLKQFRLAPSRSIA